MDSQGEKWIFLEKTSIDTYTEGKYSFVLFFLIPYVLNNALGTHSYSISLFISKLKPL